MRDFKVYYGIPTYTQYERAKQAVEHIIKTSTLVPDEIVIVDNSEERLATNIFLPLHLMKKPKGMGVRLYYREKNILSGAWNDIMRLYNDDYIIIANDDVIPEPNAIEALVTTAREHPEYAMVTGAACCVNSYSFFLLRKWAYDIVGAFDENFVPAYFEDNDYDYRLRILAGLIRAEAPNAIVKHIGSATMKAMTEEQRSRHHHNFAFNQRYFEAKWGGMPTKEKFTIPFQQTVEVEDE
ncbi:MAG TPA: glycosyltransferase [Nitrososphaeraceae archaeon]|nr:glycosyltransferase [Nitrososphaeraceae archaeon]